MVQPLPLHNLLIAPVHPIFTLSRPVTVADSQAAIEKTSPALFGTTWASGLCRLSATTRAFDDLAMLEKRYP